MPKTSIAKKKFKKTIDNYWECQVIENSALCNSKLKQNKGSTSNLVKHLNNSHNGMYEKMKNGLIPVDDEFENQELLNSKDPGYITHDSHCLFFFIFQLIEFSIFYKICRSNK